MVARALDHVALWVDDRDALASVLISCCGMHEIERTEDFTLVGGDARRGKLTLFEAPGPRDRGRLERVVVRVPALADTRACLETSGLTVNEVDGGMMVLDAPSGLPLGLVEAGANESGDLDRVALRVADPAAAAAKLESMGLERLGDDLRVADKRLILREGADGDSERPLLNHLGLLVDETSAVEDESRERGLEIDRVVDAANTRAVFVHGPDGILVEFVEHKPGFSLV